MELEKRVANGTQKTSCKWNSKNELQMELEKRVADATEGRAEKEQLQMDQMELALAVRGWNSLCRLQMELALAVRGWNSLCRLQMELALAARGWNSLCRLQMELVLAARGCKSLCRLRMELALPVTDGTRFAGYRWISVRAGYRETSFWPPTSLWSGAKLHRAAFVPPENGFVGPNQRRRCLEASGATRW